VNGEIAIGVVLALATAMPLAWKWQLGLLRSGLVAVALALGAALVVVAIDAAVGLPSLLAVGLVWLLTLCLAAAVVLYRFFRDPERRVPDGDGVIVSPADGEVVYVREARGGVLPKSTKLGRDYQLDELTKTPLATEDAVVIGVAMSFLDVHVNRAPLGGRIAVMRRFPGLFGSLRSPEMIFENERATLVIERGDLQIAVVQIASRLVRRIVPYVVEGDDVVAGQRIGMIRFGSQVDLVLPRREGLRVTAEAGDRVSAGETIVALFEQTSLTKAAIETGRATAGSAGA
jgi:phosphatidylserine decarboxylase